MARSSAMRSEYTGALFPPSKTAQHMANKWDEIVLPLHEFGFGCGACGANGSAFDAAMVCPLAPSPFEEYYALVQAGKCLAGRPIWGVEFDLAE